MEKPYVFCGCQTYPSASAGSNSKKSCWEWDIPTPKPKSKRISQSNPAFPNPKKFDMDSINKRYSENLYEPVNPPPLYGNEYPRPKEHDTTSLDERMIEIPPEIEIITSEGLDGLDMPDPHDRGIDGDREWRSVHPERPEGDDSSSQQYPKTVFTAGIRSQASQQQAALSSKHGEASSIRPLSNKSITFSPDVPPDAEEDSVKGKEAEQEVPQKKEEAPTATPEEPQQPSTSEKLSALQQLKSKAGEMKQRIRKISLPVRPKFNQWTNIKLAKGRGKGKQSKEDGGAQEVGMDQRVPEGSGGWTEPLSLIPEPEKRPVQGADTATNKASPQPMETDETAEREEELVNPNDAFDQFFAKQEQAEADSKTKAEEDLKKLRDLDKQQRDKEQEELKRLKAEEKLQKQKLAQEQKLQKEKEKQEKDKQLEEQKRTKAEEKARKDTEKEELKKQKAEEKLQNDKLQEEIKRVQEEETKKAVDEGLQQPSDPDASQAEVDSVGGAGSSLQAKTPEKKRKLIDLDFTKRFKRSKTPPAKSEPSQSSSSKLTRKGRAGPTENQLASQYAKELETRNSDMQQEKLREPQILVTQPSVETESGSVEESSRSWAPSFHGGSVSPSSSRRQTIDEELAEVDEDERQGATASSDRQAKSKENLEKFKKNLQGFGVKSKAMAAQTGKNFGQKMKVFGHGIKDFGVNAVQEVKAKQAAVRQRDAEKRAEMAENDDAYKPSSQKIIKFKFKKRDKPQPQAQVPEPDTKMVYEEPVVIERSQTRQKARPPLSSRDSPKSYPVTERNREPRKSSADDSEDKFLHRSQVLGRADRDWESPLDLARSREQSEEPFSGISSRGSPPGSSMASSSIMPGRRHGVLEEIDSDEFFLRERGISEGEDEEEVNRFLVEELRQAFRPTMGQNALHGFDLPSSPSRPGRAPKKPPRKSTENNFQTFPPERPKRKRTPGYVSAYINENPEAGDFEESQDGGMEIIGAVPEEDLDIDIGIEEDDEGIRRVKEELRKLDEDLEDDDGKYEPINDESQSPMKPQRSRRKKPKQPSTPQAFYYNTIAANEWMRDIEDQVVLEGQDLPQIDPSQQPVPPKRIKSKSQSGSVAADIDRTPPGEDEIDPDRLRLDSSVHSSRIDNRDLDDEDDALGYEDEAGYAVVHKDRPAPGGDDMAPKSLPRKKKKRPSSKGNSLKRRQQPPGSNQQVDGASGNSMFFSLPRYTPRTFHIVPPTRPHRNYSTLRPKRPPRNKSKSNQNLQATDTLPTSSRIPRPITPLTPVASPASRRADDRPTSSMQGRPLPPPPRPERSAAALNDLDQASAERAALNPRHYANFDEDIDDLEEIHEELFTKKNISLLTQSDTPLGSLNPMTSSSDINVAVQTDPVNEDEFELNIHDVESFEEVDERIEKHSSVGHQPLNDVRSSLETRVPPPIPQRPLPPAQVQQPVFTPPQIVFPTRLHLDELQVDVLRVNDLTARTLSLTTQIIAPRLELNSLTTRGNLSVSSITTPSLTADQIDCSTLSSETADFISIPPPSFASLASPASESPATQQPSPDKLEIQLEEQSRLASSSPSEISEETTPSPTIRSPESGSSAPVPRTFIRRTLTPTLPTSPSQVSTADPDLEDIAQTGMRLGRALLRVTLRSLQAMAEYVETAASNDPDAKDQQRANMQVLICLLLMFVAGVFLMIRSGSTEPRWQYLLPPQDM